MMIMSQCFSHMREMKEVIYDGFMKWFYEMRLQKEAYKNRIDEYTCMENEFEDMKTKMKYDNGRFPENDRKDNEIIILRAENVNIKQAINQLEKANQYLTGELLKKDEETKQYHKAINDLCSKLEITKKE